MTMQAWKKVLWVAILGTGLAAVIGFVVAASSLMAHRLLGMSIGLPASVTWDFTHSHAKSAVNWPNRHGNEVFRSASASIVPGETWAVDRRTLNSISIVLPGRPVLNLSNVQNAYIEEENGQVVDITVCCEPLTRAQALVRLHDAAVQWGWPWRDADYADWSSRVDGGIQSSIGAGDFRSPLWPPMVSAEIRPDAGSSWFIEWNVSWRPESRR